MNKFRVDKCIYKGEDEEDGPMDNPFVTLVSELTGMEKILFPIPEEYALMINTIIKEFEENQSSRFDVNSNKLGVYMTMLQSWNKSGVFLSGFQIDFTSVSAPNGGEVEVIDVSMILSSIADGYVEAIVEISFHNAAVLASILNLPLHLSDNLISKLTSARDGEEDGENEDNKSSQDLKNKYPIEKGVIRIAKDLLRKAESSSSEDKVLKKKPSRAKSVKKPGSTSKNKSTKNSKKDPEPPV
jgi:hypothetical protein